MELRRKIYTITNMEFQVLLVLCGIDHHYGILVMEEKIEDKILLKNLHNMVKKGILACKEETLQIEEPYKEMFEMIKKSEHKFLVEQNQETITRSGFGYFYKNVLWIEPAMHKKKAFELQIFSVDEWTDYLLEEEYVPEYKTELPEELLGRLLERENNPTLNENRKSLQLQNSIIEVKENVEENNRDKKEKIKTKISFWKSNEKTEPEWIGLYEWFGIDWIIENNRTETQIPYKKNIWKEWILKYLSV